MRHHLGRAALSAFAVALSAAAAQADVKIGVIYDYTGAFAGGGSKAAGDRHQESRST